MNSFHLALVVFKQRQQSPALLGIGLICAGVLVIHLYSNAGTH